jgi:hypothetical protein
MDKPLLTARTFPLAHNEARLGAWSNEPGPASWRGRAWSEPCPSVASPFLTEPNTPTEEPNDPLSILWKQPPKQSSSLFRRLSRSHSGHRKSNPSPADLHQTLSDLPPALLQEDEDDVVLIPQPLQKGIEMLRVTRKKFTKRICRIDPVNACVSWDSKDSSKRPYPPQ